MSVISFTLLFSLACHLLFVIRTNVLFTSNRMSFDFNVFSLPLKPQNYDATYICQNDNRGKDSDNNDDDNEDKKDRNQ